MAKHSPSEGILEDLLYQALETEQVAIKVYETAIGCAVNEDLRKEWKRYRKETSRHEQVLLGLFATFGLNPNARPHSRDIVLGVGEALVASMKRARLSVTPEQAELVACEAVVMAETKAHLNWKLLAHLVERGAHQHHQALRVAVEEVEDDEDHHLYFTKRWCRESWIHALGFPTALPPLEEIAQVQTRIGGAFTAQSRETPF